MKWEIAGLIKKLQIVQIVLNFILLYMYNISGAAYSFFYEYIAKNM